MLFDLFTKVTVGRLCILGGLLAVFYVSALRLSAHRKDIQFAREQGCKPPTLLPVKLPLGVDIVAKGFRAGRQKKLLDLITYYIDIHGPTLEIDLLGGRGFATMDPANVEAILSTQFEDFELGIRSLGFRALVGEGIFTQDDQAWKHSRELLRHRFARMQYQNLRGFRDHIEHLIHTLQQSQGTIDLQPHFYRLTLDTTIAMILGQPIQDFKHETGDNFARAFRKATLVTATRVRLGVNYWMYAPQGFFAACDTVRNYTEQFVKVVLDRGQASKESVDHDRSASDQGDRDNFIHDLDSEYHDTSLVRDQVLNILLAGRDTTAATISYTFRFLIRNPTVFKKLQEEIEATVGDETDITRAHIQQMSYLRNVVNETLRLRPPVPLNTRFCKRTTTIPHGGGEDGLSPILIRKGDSVAYSVYNMHRRTDIFGEDALTWRPERWDDLDMANNKWAFLPFNGGPRLCLGKDFGTMLASYTIIRIIQAFPNVHLPPGEPVEMSEGERQDVGLVLSTPDGCKAILR